MNPPPPSFLYRGDSSYRVMDLTRLPDSSVDHVERWLRSNSLIHEIVIDGTRESMEEVVYTLGETVAALPVIRRICIQGDPLRVSVDSIAYLRYYLAMDQYRTYEVDIRL